MIEEEQKREETGERRLNVSGVLRILGVSRSGYLSFKNSAPSKQQLRKESCMEEIIEIYEESQQIYGAPKICKELEKKGEKISEKTVGNYMRELGIKAHYIKPYKKTTIDSNFSLERKNTLKQAFNPENPDTVWCSDITYIWTLEGFVYLTSIMDLYSRRIISWVLSDTLEAKHVVEAIELAKTKRKIGKPLVIHSDRGVQYTCEEYQEVTDGFIRSYSKKAYPWDNACKESFHSLIKREWLNRIRIRDHAHASQLVFEYIETFYNTIRIHSHCDYQSPKEYEDHYQKEKGKQEKAS
jgi:transposase InsO family protein